jgi:hypothetical protein
MGPSSDLGWALGTRLGNGRGQVFLENYGCLTLPEFGGRALAWVKTQPEEQRGSMPTWNLFCFLES